MVATTINHSLMEVEHTPPVHKRVRTLSRRSPLGPPASLPPAAARGGAPCANAGLGALPGPHMLTPGAGALAPYHALAAASCRQLPRALLLLPTPWGLDASTAAERCHSPFPQILDILPGVSGGVTRVMVGQVGAAAAGRVGAQPQPREGGGLPACGRRASHQRRLWETRRGSPPWLPCWLSF